MNSLHSDAARDQIEKVAELIKDIQFAFLTTVAPDGSLHSRPMGTCKHRFDGTLYFFTKAPSQKTDEIHREMHAAVTYSNPAKQDYVAISGIGLVVRDPRKAEELWTPWMKTWFPKGLMDPELALLRVQAHDVEYWDSPSSALVHLYGLAKVTLTGEPPKRVGEHEAFNVAPR